MPATYVPGPNGPIVLATGAGGSSVTWDTGHARNITFTNGNLTIKNTSGTAAFGNTRSTTSHSSGKYYAEFTVDADDNASSMGVGLVNASFGFPDAGNFLGNDNDSIAEYDNQSGNHSNQGYFLNGTQNSLNIGTFTAGAVICMAVDLDNSKIWWRKNGGNWNNSGAADPATNTVGISITALGGTNIFMASEVETSGEQFTANFGNTAFAQTAPSGFGNW